MSCCSFHSNDELIESETKLRSGAQIGLGIGTGAGPRPEDEAGAEARLATGWVCSRDSKLKASPHVGTAKGWNYLMEKWAIPMDRKEKQWQTRGT